MRIISGTHRGRRIPFNNRRFGNARVTSDFLKEAVFGSLAPDLMDQRLLDPFAGSGQIGLEAISRGAIVWMNDRDRKRYTFIQTLVTDWQLEDQVTLTNDDWRKLLKKIADATCESFDIAYIDPPYDSVSAEGLPESEACLTELNNRGLIRPGGSVFVQHSHRTGLSDRIGDLKLDRSKKYGDSLLSRYSLG